MSQPQTEEEIRHRHALEIEERKWAYRKEELRYLEAGQHLRSLNQLMWQVPSLAIAITGGLWYGATVVGDDTARRFLFIFSGTVDVLTIVTLWRLRSIIGKHLAYQIQFAGVSDQDRFRRVVISCWSVALLAAAVGGGMGAWSPSLFNKKAPDVSPAASGTGVCLQSAIAIAPLCGMYVAATPSEDKKCTR
ncbi:hypothetical protein [Burkholderia anthina]|uniref:hypothetical protein n=1 Tax=Burkholderia anthina TaxID=179879 RepID=UPI00158A2A39|nr:hypothetical protein [Burkholderia anthina]